MNINIYIEDELGTKLNSFAKKSHISRNAIIREAIKQWIKQHKNKKWPSSILIYSGINDMPSFESYRDELLPPTEDPLA